MTLQDKLLLLRTAMSERIAHPSSWAVCTVNVTNSNGTKIEFQLSGDDLDILIGAPTPNAEDSNKDPGYKPWPGTELKSIKAEHHSPPSSCGPGSVAAT